MNKYTIFDFQAEFPDDAACLDFLKDLRWPDGIFCDTCQRVTKHHRTLKRMSYSCDWCGHHVYPMAGTIYQKSRTPLRLWFHAVFLMASTRGGISAKQVQRETGVTYKTAWRMFHQIRSLLSEDDGPLHGTVEIDETWVGGKRRYRGGERRPRDNFGGFKRGRRRKEDENKTPVIGMAERQGRIRAFAVPNVSAKAIHPKIRDHVLPQTMVYTDEAKVYHSLGKRGYEHRRVHHGAKVYVDGDVHTNTLEGFWSLMKRGISGVYHAVSAKYLQSYVNEYTFRYNHRKDETPMFRTMLCRVNASRDETPS